MGLGLGLGTLSLSENKQMCQHSYIMLISLSHSKLRMRGDAADDLLHSQARSQAGTMCRGAESVGSDRRLLYSTMNLLVSFCDLGADRSRD